MSTRKDEPAPPEVEPGDAVPMWESDDAPGAAPADTPSAGATALWDAFSPELARPSRPWSVAAAMVELEPLAPSGPPPSRSVPQPAVPVRLGRPHAFTVITAVAVIVAAAVFVFSRLDLGHTSGPGVPVGHTAFVLDSLRVVSAGSASQVPGAPTADHIAATATAIYLDVTYRNVTADDSLQIVIILEPPQQGQPPVTVSDETHRSLDPGGQIAVTVPAPPGGFTPGTYQVRALHDGTLEQQTQFTVDQS